MPKCMAQALQLLEQVQPHVLVSDIGMPDADGFDLLAQIRAHASLETAGPGRTDGGRGATGGDARQRPTLKKMMQRNT